VGERMDKIDEIQKETHKQTVGWAIDMAIAFTLGFILRHLI